MEDNFQKLTDRMTSSQLDLYYAILNEIEHYRSLSLPEEELQRFRALKFLACCGTPSLAVYYLT